MITSLVRKQVNVVGRGLQELMYPRICSHCDGRIESSVRFVCLACRGAISTLDLHTLIENEMTDRFWGRLPLTRAASLLPYGQGLPAQRLMWSMKYDNRPEIGNSLGGWLGSLVTESEVFGTFDAIVPVPLHPLRLKSRGYNQAARIAEGIGEATGVEVLAQAVLRVKHTSTQTAKSSFARVENMMEVFQLSPKHDLRGKIILLVDDVMTTGATLEAVGREILKGDVAELKVATLALARKF